MARENFTHGGIGLKIAGFFCWLFTLFTVGTGIAKEKFRNPFNRRKHLFGFARRFPDKKKQQQN
jgi:hypothetical protein